MRKYLTTALAIALMSGVSYADLQNVEVGGSVRIRGNSFYDVGSDENNKANQSTEQRTEIDISADLSDEVSVNITLDNYGVWGGTQSSGDAVSALDTDNPTVDEIASGLDSIRNSDIGLYEAYISLGDAVAGFDLQIGRQELLLGSEFLVGNENTASGFTGRSFDGIVGRYSGDTFDLTLLSLKINEVDGLSATSVDEDTDLYGVYATYNGLEDHTIDGYILYRRIGVPGVDNDELFTYGARATGTFAGSFDYELEVAIQDGDQSATVDYEGTAINAELGYTFDSNMQPRVFIGVAQFEGSDDATEAGFDRLFSDWEYSEFLGDGDMSNVLILRAGVGANVTEKINLSAVVSTFELDEEGDTSYNGVVATSTTEDDLGTEIGLYATYQYSEDVAIEVGYATLLNGDAIKDGVNATSSEEDQTYVYAEISVSF